jgi:hypothetical protein
MAPEAEEKREFVRVPFTTEVEVRIGERTIRSLSGINISLSGLHLATDQAFPVAGTPCRVTILLKASEESVAIQAEGTVIRSGAGGLAIEFTALDPDSYHHLRRLIINNAGDPDRAEQEFIAHWGIRRPLL